MPVFFKGVWRKIIGYQHQLVHILSKTKSTIYREEKQKNTVTMTLGVNTLILQIIKRLNNIMC